jgi:hypothetical protein
MFFGVKQRHNNLGSKDSEPDMGCVPDFNENPYGRSAKDCSGYLSCEQYSVPVVIIKEAMVYR